MSDKKQRELAARIITLEQQVAALIEAQEFAFNAMRNIHPHCNRCSLSIDQAVVNGCSTFGCDFYKVAGEE